MYPTAIWPPPHVIALGNDRPAPLADLAWGVRLVVFRLKILNLPFRTVMLLDLVLGQVLVIARTTTLGLLPHALFLAVLGRYGHRLPWKE
jgi:hypothetical protein